MSPSSLLEPSFLKRLAALRLLVKGRVRSSYRGERAGSATGQGQVFADHRVYRPGDDLRHLDWPALARLDQLLIKLHERDDELTITLILDSSRSMAGPKLHHAQRLAAALAYVGLKGRDRVGLVSLSDHVRSTLAPRRGKGKIRESLDFLQSLQADGPTDLARALRALASSGKGGMVVLLSDLLDPHGAPQTLALLGAASRQAHALWLMSPDELSPSIRGELDLVDSETGETIRVLVDDQSLKVYAAVLADHQRSLETAARRCGVNLIPALTSTPIEEMVLSLLRKRGLLA